MMSDSRGAAFNSSRTADSIPGSTGATSVRRSFQPLVALDSFASDTRDASPLTDSSRTGIKSETNSANRSRQIRSHSACARSNSGLAASKSSCPDWICSLSQAWRSLCPAVGSFT